MDVDRYKEYTLPIIRIGISIVFLWFGINQLLFPDNFMGYLPEFLLNSDYAPYVPLINGLFEVIHGSLLLVGLFIRPVAFLLGLHLLVITSVLGYNDIAVRDFGLMITTFAISIGGAHTWSLDERRSRS